MKLSYRELAQRFAAELGADGVTNEASLLAAHAVDGKEPALVCFPETSDQIAAVMRICSEADAAVIPWGGGTAMRIGNPPRRADVVLGLSRLNRLGEHDDANLTVTVGAGTRVGNLQNIVAGRKQFLAFDPPCPARATVGGVVATNLNGPRRSYYGSVRDIVIGMKVALASGEQIKAGGKVVKNVAGYDMCKLFVGSLGTLGVITEVTLRMAPIPETAATSISSGTLSKVLLLVGELSNSKLLPSAVLVSNAKTSSAGEIGQSDWCIAVCCEGFERSVARQIRDVQEMARRTGLASEILKEAAYSGFWQRMHDFPLQADRLVYRVTVPRASTAEVIKTIASWSSTDFRPEIVSDAAVGIIWISLEVNDVAPQWFDKLIAHARERRGHGIIFAAPANLKQGVDIWGSAPPTLFLMREIKRQFDPQGLLNPGRFVAGI
jgi:glycolate dehydrogenase FAD-binding subunit